MKENCIVIGIFSKRDKEEHIYRRLNEINALSDTAGYNVIETIIQKIDRINPAFYMGKGKIEELRKIIYTFDINTIIVSNSLTPVQMRNLEEELNIKVIDRNELILIIFAKNARTNISLVEVELAQLKFIYSRLTGKGIVLSRTGGGIGTRGPGEQKIEMDRRKIQKRIHLLEQKLEKYKRDSILRKKQRKNIFNVSLLGYTNAGKTSIINYFTKNKFESKDSLFTTLDTTVRKFYKNIVLIDTIGFLGELPHELISSFSLTLEEALDSDLKIIVLDISDEYLDYTIEDVNSILNSLSKDSNRLYVFNKIDNVVNIEKIDIYKRMYENAVFVSAKTGENMDILKEKILEKFYSLLKFITIKVKKDNTFLLNFILNHGIIKNQTENENEYIFSIYIAKKHYNKLMSINKEAL